jgi:hypothetical protein
VFLFEKTCFILHKSERCFEFFFFFFKVLCVETFFLMF